VVWVLQIREESCFFWRKEGEVKTKGNSAKKQRKIWVVSLFEGGDAAEKVEIG